LAGFAPASGVVVGSGTETNVHAY
jgi:Aldolase/RraA